MVEEEKGRREEKNRARAREEEEQRNGDATETLPRLWFWAAGCKPFGPLVPG